MTAARVADHSFTFDHIYCGLHPRILPQSFHRNGFIRRAMPRKRTSNTAMPAPGSAITKLSRAQRQSTHSKVTFEGVSVGTAMGDVIDVGDGEDDDGGDGEEDGEMLEMLSMLQQIQKHKATKTSSHSNTAFQNEKTALFNGARKNVETIVHDGVTYIDQCKARVAELRAQETSQEDHFKDLSLLWKNHDECIRGLLGTYPSLIETLSHRRAEYINDASAMLEAHAVERQRSRRRLVMNARARMDENIENQKLATDATALIKHYKALLLS